MKQSWEEADTKLAQLATSEQGYTWQKSALCDSVQPGLDSLHQIMQLHCMTDATAQSTALDVGSKAPKIRLTVHKASTAQQESYKTKLSRAHRLARSLGLSPGAHVREGVAKVDLLDDALVVLVGIIIQWCAHPLLGHVCASWLEHSEDFLMYLWQLNHHHFLSLRAAESTTLHTYLLLGS